MTDDSLTRRAVLATTLTGTASLLPSSGVSAADSGGNESAPPVQRDGPAHAPHEEYVVDVHPETPGAWVRLDIEPNDAGQLLYDPPEFVAVHRARGFDRVEDGLWWTGTATPQLVYTVDPRFRWGLGDRWGFLSIAEVLLSTESTETTRSVTLANGGYEHPDTTGQSYVGPADIETRELAGATTTYVRPDRWHAPTAPSPETFFQIVETTADALSLTAPYPTTGYAAPSLDGASGYARRAAVADTALTHFAFLGDSLPTIAHEYVHTQQAYFEAHNYSWLLEGMATFYEHLMGYRHGLKPLSPLDGVSRADPLLGGRRTSVVYDKGAAMCFLLDRRLRELTDGEKTLRDVFQALNAFDGDEEVIGHDQFKEIVAGASGVRLDGWLDERIAEPFEIDLPEDLTEQYPGTDSPRPIVEASPATVTPGGSDDLLLVGFEDGRHQPPLDSVELQIRSDDATAVRIGSVTPTGDRHESATNSGNGRERTLTLSFTGSDRPSLGAVAPISVSLEPTAVGASRITLTGSVTDEDGQTESLAPAVSGTRALVDTPPPAPPRVVPRVVPVGEPVELFVLDPDPSLRYAWRFDGSEYPQAVGPQVTRRFSLRGEQTVEVTAVDRTGDRTTSSSTITVTEDAPGLGAYVDTECLLRRHGFGGLSGWSSTDDSSSSIELVRQCYAGSWD
jgi:hypothetical protein